MTRPSVLIALIFAALTGFAIWWIYPRPLPEVVICQSLIPNAKDVGLKFSRSKDAITVDFGSAVTTSTATAEAASAFIECLERGGRVNLLHAARLEIHPIGQIADQWKADASLRLILMPGGDERLLNNLRIGPAVGRKHEIMREWCSVGGNGKCVECAPQAPTAATPYVEINLRPGARAERQQLPGTWAGAAPGGRLQPWEIVENGKRFVYVCKR